MKYLLLIIATLPSLANAEEQTHMGRLFFTPNDRATMNVIRKNSKAPDKVIKAEDISKDDDVVTEQQAPVAIRPVIMNGYISRSDGKNTLWINDRAVTEKTAAGEVNVGQLNKNQVKVTVNKNKSANLKPGQVYDPNTGKIYNHLSEAPKPVMEEAEPESAIDKVSKTLGLDELKKKASELVDALSPKASTAATTTEK